MKTLTEAITQLYQTITQRSVMGASHDLDHQRQMALESVAHPSYSRTLFDGQWERAWGAGCSLSARKVEGKTRKGEPVWELECEISWSSTGHCVTSALCAVTLYREVIELAAYMEAQWGNVGRE